MIEPNKVLKQIQSIKPKQKTSQIDIIDATNQISATTIKASINLPRFRTSAMDGYAISIYNKKQKYEIKGRILSGEDKSFDINSSQTVKIMTGAKVPDSACIVVPIEDVELSNNHIKLKKKFDVGQNIRTVGEDIKQGDIVIKQNECINFATICVLASQGVKDIEVYDRLKVAIFASGEELKNYQESIKPHQIYNSNSPSLVARCKELNCDVKFIGTSKDDIKSIENIVKQSLDFDIIITSGGASVGDADWTKKAFENLNMNMLVEGIKIKPGKPTMIGKIGETYVLNLPGNPFAMQIIFEMFGTILIEVLKHSSAIYHKIIKTKLKENFSHKAKYTTLLPGYFDGENFNAATKKLPGMVSVLNNNNSFAVINTNTQTIKKNQDINIIPINHKEFSTTKKSFEN